MARPGSAAAGRGPNPPRGCRRPRARIAGALARPARRDPEGHRRGARMLHGELPHDRVRGLLRGRVRPVLAVHAASAALAPVHPRRLVLLLRLGRPALGAAADRLDAREHVRGAGDRAHAVATVRKRALAAAVVFDLGLLGVFKYLGFFVSRSTTRSTRSGSARRCRCCRSCCRSASRSSPSRRSPTWWTCTAARRRAASLGDVAILQAFFPHLVAGPIVRANELLPQLRTPRDPRAVLAGPALFLIAGGLVKKTVVADELARSIVDPVFNDPAAHSGPEVAARDLRLRRPDLLRLLRLHRHGDRPGAAARLPAAAELRPALPGAQPPGLLAALAHDAVALAARLPLHPARRQPRRAAADLPQPDAHDAARRPLARRGLDVRGLGRHPRQALSRRALGARALPRLARCPRWVGWLVTFNVVCLAWVFFRAPDLATAFEVLGRSGAGGPSPLVTLPVVFLDGRGRGGAGGAAGLVAATPRRGSWPGPPSPRAWRSACSSWPPTPPSASRAWPRSSTTASEPCGPRGQRPRDARRPGARRDRGGARPGRAVQLGGDRARGRGHEGRAHARHRAVGRRARWTTWPARSACTFRARASTSRSARSRRPPRAPSSRAGRPRSSAPGASARSRRSASPRRRDRSACS